MHPELPSFLTCPSNRGEGSVSSHPCSWSQCRWFWQSCRSQWWTLPFVSFIAVTPTQKHQKLLALQRPLSSLNEGFSRAIEWVEMRLLSSLPKPVLARWSDLIVNWEPGPGRHQPPVDTTVHGYYLLLLHLPPGVCVSRILSCPSPRALLFSPGVQA